MKSIHTSLKRIGAALLLAGTISSFALASTPPTSREEVSERAKRALTSNFPKAADVKWMESNNGTVCTAYFWLRDVKTVASYSSDGELISVLKYYGKEHLSDDMLSRLESKYPTRTIAGVTELTDSNEDVSYFIKMEDEAHWYTVKINSDGMTQTEKLSKQ